MKYPETRREIVDDPVQEKTMVIVGDLHYEADEEETFKQAHAQIRALNPDIVISLGDMGGYSHCGTRSSFEEGHRFFSTFSCPFYAVLGNHDFEGPEFSSDEASIRAWCEALGAPSPYQAVDLGGAMAVLLSQTEYRSNLGTEGEVRLDPGQIAWFRQILRQTQTQPVFVFSHAPILGSGLRVLQDIHLRNPNAWLNHAEGASQFIPMVQASDRVRLWFSAHNHLGQDYPDSVTTVGQCTFVHVGVIGSRSRDGKHQSRLLKFDCEGWRMFSLDHITGDLRADFTSRYETGEVVRLFTPSESVGGRHFPPAPCPTGKDRLAIGNSVFLIYRGMLVEYDADLGAPLGVVAEGMEDWILSSDGERIIARNASGECCIFARSVLGRFFTVHAPNPFLVNRGRDETS
ncbi:MAG TPA: metallophosphoesterase [Candidatus Angelobacter sp.]|jgi:predicted MPP superfamily phosphohydrolase|nr:metallophosphoesterase [Candidatus Angelobacter sp.]